MKLVAIFLILLSACAFALLAEAPLAVPPPQPTELQRLRLLASFEKALLAQQQAQQAQAQFEQARQSYTDLAEAVSKEMSLPSGTEFRIDAQRQKVDVILPPPKPPETKPDSKK